MKHYCKACGSDIELDVVQCDMCETAIIPAYQFYFNKPEGDRNVRAKLVFSCRPADIGYDFDFVTIAMDILVKERMNNQLGYEASWEFNDNDGFDIIINHACDSNSGKINDLALSLERIINKMPKFESSLRSVQAM